MMVPFTSMVIWTFQEKVASSWKKILWYSGKIAFIFSISMDVSKFYHGDYYLEEEVKTMRGKGIASRKKSSI